jgi:hypothetical protein
MHAAVLISRAGHFQRIPVTREGDNVLSLADHWTGLQTDAMQRASKEERRAVAALLTKIVDDLELVREAITMAVAHQMLDDALTALVELTEYTVDGVEHARPIVRNAFLTRRCQIVSELYNLICNAAEQLYGVPIERAPISNAAVH